MHFHFCGNPLHDVPMFVSAFVAEIPMLVQVAVWLRAKFSRPKTCEAGCAHEHKEKPMRWIIVSKETGEPVGPKTSFPTKALAAKHCGPLEKPAKVHVVERSGPFSDVLAREPEYGLGYMQGRGAA